MLLIVIIIVIITVTVQLIRMFQMKSVRFNVLIPDHCGCCCICCGSEGLLY